METPNALAAIECDEGILILGSDAAVAHFSCGLEEARSRALSPATLRKLSLAAGVSGHLQASAGRWVRLDDATVAALAKHASTNKVLTGAVRGEGGKIVKHLAFEKATLLTPAAPAMVASLAAQQAIQAALDDITEYLEVIDAKLDRLLKQRKVETLGHLGGVMLTIDEAMHIYEQTGLVSEVTWSKVQTNSLVLQTMQAESLSQLDAIRDEVRGANGSVDDLASVLGRAEEDVTFWLGVLARALALQDKQHVLELDHVAAREPDNLEAHRRGLSLARAERGRKVSRALEGVALSVRDSASLTHRARVANPINAQRVTSSGNRIVDAVVDLARHLDAGLPDAGAIEGMPWLHAARGLLNDTASQVTTAGAGASQRARVLGSRLQTRRDEALLAKADKIRGKRAE